MLAFSSRSLPNIILLLYTASCSATFAIPSTLSISECYTAYATTSTRPVPTVTKSYDNTITYPVIVIKRPSTTITPTPVTSTTTTTTTTTSTSEVPQVTDTFSTFSTTTTTETTTLPTATTTVLSTTTTTTTNTVDVLTIPTAAGFRPILDTLPAAQAKKRDTSFDAPSGGLIARAALLARADRTTVCPAIPRNGKPLPKQYPKSVTCYVIKQVFVAKPTTKFAGPTVTSTAPPTTSTVTNTETDTTVVVVTTPNASTTITATSTVTDTSTYAPSTTTTQTITATVIETQGRATAYAQCASNSNNYASSVNGQGISGAYTTTTELGNTVNTPDTTRESCCNTCAANPGCAASIFFGGFGPGQQCFNLPVRDTSNTCPVQGIQLGLLYGGGIGAGEGYIASNGVCGQFNQAAPA